MVNDFNKYIMDFFMEKDNNNLQIIFTNYNILDFELSFVDYLISTLILGPYILNWRFVVLAILIS